MHSTSCADTQHDVTIFEWNGLNYKKLNISRTEHESSKKYKKF